MEENILIARLTCALTLRHSLNPHNIDRYEFLHMRFLSTSELPFYIKEITFFSCIFLIFFYRRSLFYYAVEVSRHFVFQKKKKKKKSPYETILKFFPIFIDKNFLYKERNKRLEK